MPDLLKWSPFATTRWTSPFNTLMRSPSELVDSLDRLFEAHSGPALIRIEEFVDGRGLVMRAEMPGLDPDKDVEVTLLHDDVKEEDITATLSDGVLEVRTPVPGNAAGPAAPKKLPITRA